MNDVHGLINRAIERVNELRPATEPIPTDPATVLLGPQGHLDSMAFVNLLVALEEELDQRLGVKVFLGDIIANEPEITTIADLRELLERVVQNHKIPGS